MRRGNEILDGAFVLGQPGVDVCRVDDPCALGLGQDQVEEEEKADVGVERDPVCGLLARSVVFV